MKEKKHDDLKSQLMHSLITLCQETASLPRDTGSSSQGVRHLTVARVHMALEAMCNIAVMNLPGTGDGNSSVVRAPDS